MRTGKIARKNEADIDYIAYRIGKIENYLKRVVVELLDDVKGLDKERKDAIIKYKDLREKLDALVLHIGAIYKPSHGKEQFVQSKRG